MCRWDGVFISRSAFSLVELSIVLVILGLLTGGILAGQSLIRASELRAVVSEYQRYVAATNTFRDKYFALPGDMTNAASFWGASTNNGNGDGIINDAAAVSVTGEAFEFWNQLALAGLIEGKYSGVAGPNAGHAGLETIPGTNAPKSKIASAGWAVRNLTNNAGDGWFYAFDYGNLMVIGKTQTGDWPVDSLFKPEEAWNLDTKLDDGIPGSGKVIAIGWPTCTTSASKTDYSGSYALTTSALSCALAFTKLF